MIKFEGFMAAVRHLQDYRKQNSRPAAIDALRRAERDVADVACGITGNVGEAVTEHNVTQAAVCRALADLPKYQRTMLILICVDGMSYQEAADVLDIPIGAMANRMARARRALHEQIVSHSQAGAAGTGIPSMPAWAGTARGEH
jgi:DNA-directed RNA polymerase specialized sigma24 family protein